MVYRHKISVAENAFRVLNYALLAALALITLFPFWFAIQASFSDPTEAMNLFWPREYFAKNYWLVFTTDGLGRAYFITVLRVLVAVPPMLIVTGSAAFALTRKELKGRKIIILYYFITMFIGGGLIPFYMLLKSVGLLDSFWVFVFPTIFSVWTMIVMKTSFQGLPEGLVDAALLDGASYGRIFFGIILPLSIPMITTLGLFQAVWHWNEWFMGAYYIKEPRLRPLQTFLRYAILSRGGNSIAYSILEQMHLGDDPRVVLEFAKVTPESLKLAFLVLTTVPILFVYPFIQRYFMKGVLLGSIKE